MTLEERNEQSRQINQAFDLMDGFKDTVRIGGKTIVIAYHKNMHPGKGFHVSYLHSGQLIQHVATMWEVIQCLAGEANKMIDEAKEEKE